MGAHVSGVLNMHPQTIGLVSAGAREYTRRLYMTDLYGNDISADPIKLSLGTEDAPATWLTPGLSGVDVVSVAQYLKMGGRNPFGLQTTALLYRRWAQLYIAPGAVEPAVGSYRLWSQLGDSSEIIPRIAFKVIVT